MLCLVKKSIITGPLIQLTKSLVKHRFSLHVETEISHELHVHCILHQ